MITCARCKREIVRDPQSCGTGYGIRPDGGKVCYECCGELDREDMRATGSATLYLSPEGARWQVGNWPGTLRFPVYGLRHSWHNFAGRNGRRDFWFAADGDAWHGVNIGDSQIAYCRRVRGGTK